MLWALSSRQRSNAARNTNHSALAGAADRRHEPSGQHVNRGTEFDEDR